MEQNILWWIHWGELYLAVPRRGGGGLNKKPEINHWPETSQSLPEILQHETGSKQTVFFVRFRIFKHLNLVVYKS